MGCSVLLLVLAGLGCCHAGWVGHGQGDANRQNVINFARERLGTDVHLFEIWEEEVNRLPQREVQLMEAALNCVFSKDTMYKLQLPPFFYPREDICPESDTVSEDRRRVLRRATTDQELRELIIAFASERIEDAQMLEIWIMEINNMPRRELVLMESALNCEFTEDEMNNLQLPPFLYSYTDYCPDGKVPSDVVEDAAPRPSYPMQEDGLDGVNLPSLGRPDLPAWPRHLAARSDEELKDLVRAVAFKRLDRSDIALTNAWKIEIERMSHKDLKVIEAALNCVFSQGDVDKMQLPPFLYPYSEICPKAAMRRALAAEKSDDQLKGAVATVALQRLDHPNIQLQGAWAEEIIHMSHTDLKVIEAALNCIFSVEEMDRLQLPPFLYPYEELCPESAPETHMSRPARKLKIEDEEEMKEFVIAFARERLPESEVEVWVAELQKAEVDQLRVMEAAIGCQYTAEEMNFLQLPRFFYPRAEICASPTLNSTATHRDAPDVRDAWTH